MRKQYVSLLVILLTASGFFFSCSNKMNSNEGALEFDSICVNETSHLGTDTLQPGCNIVLNIAYATQSTDQKLKDSLNSIFLDACLGNKYAAMLPTEAIKQYTADYIKNYHNDLDSMYAHEKEKGTSIGQAWYSYNKTIENKIQLYHKHLLVYCIDYYEYSGGAHGMYTTTYLNMNLQYLRPLRLADLFINDYKEALTDLLWNQLMADNKVTTRAEVEDLGYTSTGELTPTENFFLAEDGITFYYNVYEIAPYVMGPVVIKLPYQVMDHILNNESLIVKEIKEKK